MTGVRTGPTGQELVAPLLRWYADSARELPWRTPSCSPWGVLVSEIMLQQTPVRRVEPVWHRWMSRWPSPADLAAEPAGEAVRAWDRLGYPRRALRLHACARVLVADHGGQVPTTLEELRALPGVGQYTAAAVGAFAFGIRSPVVDTNVRRVQARAVTGVALPAPTLRTGELALAADLLPQDPATAATWNVAVMELGALVCTARAPQCPACPLADRCAWRAAGSPAYSGPSRRSQAWVGTDRQCRGRLLAALREHRDGLSGEELTRLWHDPAQARRCVQWLVSDGLAQEAAPGHYTLPGPG